MLSEFKSSCLKTFEARRFDKSELSTYKVCFFFFFLFIVLLYRLIFIYLFIFNCFCIYISHLIYIFLLFYFPCNYIVVFLLFRNWLLFFFFFLLAFLNIWASSTHNLIKSSKILMNFHFSILSIQISHFLKFKFSILKVKSSKSQISNFQ